VHELHGGGDADVARTRVVAQLGGGDGQHRAQPLAAGIDQVMGELGDHLDLGHGLVEDDAVDAVHVLGDEVQERLQAFRRAAGARGLSNGTT
jgi:hypothetical protein